MSTNTASPLQPQFADLPKLTLVTAMTSPTSSPQRRPPIPHFKPPTPGPLLPQSPYHLSTYAPSPPSSRVAATSNMGPLSRPFLFSNHSEAAAAAATPPNRSPTTLVPGNSIRRKPVHRDLREPYRMPWSFMGGSLRQRRSPPASVSSPQLRRTRTTTARTESMEFAAAKRASWGVAQARGYLWATTGELRRVESAACLSDEDFMRRMDERKAETVRKRARQIREHEEELRAAEEFPEEGGADCPAEEGNGSISSQGEGGVGSPADVAMNDVDDENIDDYNLELQCSSSESDAGFDPRSCSWNNVNSTHYAAEASGQVLLDDDDEEEHDDADQRDNIEEDESGVEDDNVEEDDTIDEDDGIELDDTFEDSDIEEEQLPTPASPSVSEGAQSIEIEDDDGSNALAALTLTDPAALDPRSISNHAFSLANDQWLLKMVPVYQAQHPRDEVWATIHREFFLAFFSVISVPCLQARYVLLLRASPSIQRSGTK